MKKETEKLIKSLAGTWKQGNVYTNEDGVDYRYDTFIPKYKYTPYWLKLKFEAAVVANGHESYVSQFVDGDYSFNFQRAKFVGEKDRAIHVSKLVILTK